MTPLSNILIVDDNADDVFLLRQGFRKAGTATRLHAVSDGHEARSYLEGTEGFGDRAHYPLPDLLLLDLSMPRMNGLEFLQWVRGDRRFARLTIHVLTTSAREADMRRACELHANSYAVKPTRIEDLVGFVRALHEWHRFARLTPTDATAIASAPTLAPVGI